MVKKGREMSMSVVVEIVRADQTGLAGRLAAVAVIANANAVQPGKRKARSIVTIEIGDPARALKNVSRAGQAEAGPRSPCLPRLGGANWQRAARVDTVEMALLLSMVKIGPLPAEEAGERPEREGPVRRSEEKVGSDEVKREGEAKEMSAKSDSDDRGLSSKPEVQ